MQRTFGRDGSDRLRTHRILRKTDLPGRDRSKNRISGGSVAAIRRVVARGCCGWRRWFIVDAEADVL